MDPVPTQGTRCCHLAAAKIAAAAAACHRCYRRGSSGKTSLRRTKTLPVTRAIAVAVVVAIAVAVAVAVAIAVAVTVAFAIAVAVRRVVAVAVSAVSPTAPFYLCVAAGRRPSCSFLCRLSLSLVHL